MREIDPRLFAPPIDIICGHSDAIVSRERDLSVGRAEAIRACGLLHAIEIEHKVVRREAGRVCELDGLTRAVARSEDFAGDGRRRLAQRDLCRDFRIIDEWMFHHQVRPRDVVDEVVSLCHAHARALAERRDGIHAVLDRDARDRGRAHACRLDGLHDTELDARRRGCRARDVVRVFLVLAPIITRITDGRNYYSNHGWTRARSPCHRPLLFSRPRCS